VEKTTSKLRVHEKNLKGAVRGGRETGKHPKDYLLKRVSLPAEKRTVVNRGHKKR